MTALARLLLVLMLAVLAVAALRHDHPPTRTMDGCTYTGSTVPSSDAECDWTD